MAGRRRKDHLPGAETPEPTKLRPGKSLVAAAKQITAKKLRKANPHVGSRRDAAAVAWDFYDAIGELRFSANYVGRNLSRARLVAARDPKGAEEPVLIDGEVPVTAVADRVAADLVADLGGSAAGQAQMLMRLGVHLFIPGESFIVALDEPPRDDDGRIIEGAEPERVWHVLSSDEIAAKGEDTYVLDLGDEKREVNADDVLVTRVWQPHPRRWWKPDSPTLSAIDVLHELHGLTQKIAADIDSRLAGNGLLILPNSVTFSGAKSNGDDTEDDEDPFVATLIDAMTTPIKQRDSAAAVVPLVIRVPDEVVDKVKHITFSTPLDANAKDLRDEAIRRLALSIDIPPEVLLGMGDANHWSLWGIDEGTITIHIEPLLALISDALTVGYLRPAMIAAGIDEDTASEYVVWFTTDNLILRPNRSADANSAHTAGVISDAAYRRALGFDDGDAPEDVADLDPAVSVVFDLVRAAPSLAQAPGMPALLEQVRMLMGGEAPATTDAPATPSAADTPATTDVVSAVPGTQGDDPIAAAGVR